METIDGRRSYIAGRWVEGERSFEVENPADESCLAVAGVTPRSRRSSGRSRRHDSHSIRVSGRTSRLPSGPRSSMPFSTTLRRRKRS